jgi:hypothetical protein
MSHALKELLGQFDCIQRSPIFLYVGLEQGPTSSYIAHPHHARQGSNPTYSSRKAKVDLGIADLGQKARRHVIVAECHIHWYCGIDLYT